MLDSDRDGGEIDIETNTQVTGKRRTDEGNEAAGVPVIDKTHKHSDKGVKTRKRKRHHNSANKAVFDKVTARLQTDDMIPEHSDNVEKNTKSKRQQKMVTINEEDPDRSQLKLMEKKTSKV